MSGSFSGFSEDDIRKLSHKNSEELTKSHSKGSRPGRPELKQHKQRSYQTNSEIRNKILNEKMQNSRIEPILEGAKLNKVSEVSSSSSLVCDTSAHNPPSNTPDAVKNILPTSENLNTGSESAQYVQAENKGNEKKEEKKDVLQEKQLDLEEFETKRKLIEEQNRKRKELLMRALAVKTKQTQEETQKLNMIREEFKKIDNLLSDDVKFLRKQIEIASIDYMEAQKKYYKKEREYLDAKLLLQKMLDRKEMLTEHLATIIEKNEERKATKLNELLSQLNLKEDVQYDVGTEKDSTNMKQTDIKMEKTDDDDDSKSINLQKNQN